MQGIWVKNNIGLLFASFFQIKEIEFEEGYSVYYIAATSEAKERYNKQFIIAESKSEKRIYEVLDILTKAIVSGAILINCEKFIEEIHSDADCRD